MDPFMERKIRSHPIGNEQSVFYGFAVNAALISADEHGISKY